MGMEWSDLYGPLLSALSAPGDYTRGALAGRFGERVGGREMLESMGILGANEEGFDIGDLLGFGADMVVDPLNLASGAGVAAVGNKTAKGLRAAKAARGLDIAGDAARELGIAGDAAVAAGATPEVEAGVGAMAIPRERDALDDFADSFLAEQQGQPAPVQAAPNDPLADLLGNTQQHENIDWARLRREGEEMSSQEIYDNLGYEESAPRSRPSIERTDNYTNPTLEDFLNPNPHPQEQLALEAQPSAPAAPAAPREPTQPLPGENPFGFLEQVRQNPYHAQLPDVRMGTGQRLDYLSEAMGLDSPKPLLLEQKPADPFYSRTMKTVNEHKKMPAAFRSSKEAYDTLVKLGASKAELDNTPMHYIDEIIASRPDGKISKDELKFFLDENMWTTKSGVHDTPEYSGYVMPGAKSEGYQELFIHGDFKQPKDLPGFDRLVVSAQKRFSDMQSKLKEFEKAHPELAKYSKERGGAMFLPKDTPHLDEYLELSAAVENADVATDAADAAYNYFQIHVADSGYKSIDEAIAVKQAEAARLSKQIDDMQKYRAKERRMFDRKITEDGEVLDEAVGWDESNPIYHDFDHEPLESRYMELVETGTPEEYDIANKVHWQAEMDTKHQEALTKLVRQRYSLEDEIDSLHSIENHARVAATGGEAKTHWSSVKDLLSHARLTVRNDAKGRKTLFIEEIQSDRYQPPREGETKKILETYLKDAWPESTLKRVIRHAIDNKIDNIAFDTGDSAFIKVASGSPAEIKSLETDVANLGLNPKEATAKQMKSAFKDLELRRKNLEDEVALLEDKHVSRMGERSAHIGDAESVSISKKVEEIEKEIEKINDLVGNSVHTLDRWKKLKGLRTFYDEKLISIAKKIAAKHGIEIESANFLTGGSLGEKSAGEILGDPIFNGLDMQPPAHGPGTMFRSAYPPVVERPFMSINESLKNEALKGFPISSLLAAMGIGAGGAAAAASGGMRDPLAEAMSQ